MANRGDTWLSHPLLSRNADATPRAKRSPAVPLHAFGACIILLHLLVGTGMWMYLLGPNAAFGDSFYFAVVTFLTIGYGDITPKSPSSKLFFIIYTITSLVIQLTVVSHILAETLDWRPPELQRNDCETRDVKIRTFFRVWPRILRAAQGLLLLTCIVAAGAAMLTLLAQQYNRSLTWIDCWYWSVSTISTVGYGDIVPHSFRPAFAIFFLVAVVLFTYVLGESVALITEIGKYRRLENLFAEGLSPQILDRMDHFRDGQVSQVEFMMFMLEHLELVDREELDRILDVFNAADATGDGVLNLADVRARCNCSVRAPRGSNFSDALLPADARDRQEACSSATGTPSAVRGDPESEELESDV